MDFAGWLKDGRLLEAYHQSDVYASALLWEGMPIAALEAMACGLPLVLSRIMGHEELVEDGVNGYLFEPGDTARLKNILEELKRDPVRRAAMGEASRRRALEHFSWSALARKRLELYENAV